MLGALRRTLVRRRATRPRAAHLASGAARASRRGGGLARIDLGAEYRQEFADLFHGLRPLRFVLDTSSLPLAEHVRALAGTSACRIVAPRVAAAGELALPSRRKTALAGRAAAGPASALAAAAAFRAQRIERLREQVRDERLDFGLWIDGDGDTCELVDELGLYVRTERLLVAFAERLAAEAKSSGVVVEPDTSPAARARLKAAEIPCIEGGPNREAMFAALALSGAAPGAGSTGRIWFGGQFPQSDALRTLGELLQLLSDSDRALSAVLK